MGGELGAVVHGGERVRSFDYGVDRCGWMCRWSRMGVIKGMLFIQPGSNSAGGTASIAA